MKAFRAKLEPVPHGGHYIVVPAPIAQRAGLSHAARVRGTINGIAYRSSLMKYSGVFHMGVHKATLATAQVRPGSQVDVTIELDDEALPTDVVPEDLAAALKHDTDLLAAWEALRPSLKREQVKQLCAAKKPETRARRMAKTLDLLRQQKRG